MVKNKPAKRQDCYIQIKNVLDEARAKVYRQINSTMVQAYWNIGRIIVEEEQQGKAKAGYGKKLLENLSIKLTKDFGKGFDVSNLQHIRRFYLTFPIPDALRRELSWTHYRILLRVDEENARNFYLNECVESRWSTRELERQVNSMLFERLAASKDKAKVKALAEKGQIIQTPSDAIKDPYIFEFLGWPEQHTFSESDLETALIDNLKGFLLELGKGFSFVARQQRITLENDHFYIDLVFYNRLLRNFVLIDLKLGKLTHQDLGQMQMYVNYYDRIIKSNDEDSTVGIVLCKDKNETVAKFTLPEDNKNIFASKYKPYLPTEEELMREIEAVSARLDIEKQ
ncbi:MAG: PDDEXK nuclease domain-containing protein [Gammaproteobacteria bacterium]|jgi:predicted nuclease of restriction endonuclease-like (RecB) superfamily